MGSTLLRELLGGTLTGDELRLLPSGFDRIGHIAIVTLPPSLIHRSAEVGRVLLGLKGVRTVALRGGPISGRCRRPKLRIIAGEHTTETLHREHGCSFKLDASRVMFASGNLYERGRIPRLVEDGEVVVDMFAGVGQFSIPIAKHAEPSKVYAIEINPVAYGYLRENISLNRVQGVVEPILGDCADVSPLGAADRVIMGILHIGSRYLPIAMRVLRPEGGILHYHESVPTRLRFERPIKRIRAAAAGREVKILMARVVKRYAPGIDHVVIDARIGSWA